MANNKQSDMIEITGLWENDSAAGTKYLRGTWGGVTVLIFANGFKTPGSNEPDYRMYVAPRAERSQPDDEATVRMDVVDGSDSDIPF